MSCRSRLLQSVNGRVNKGHKYADIKQPSNRQTDTGVKLKYAKMQARKEPDYL